MCFLHLAQPSEEKEPLLKSKKMVIIHKLELTVGGAGQSAFRNWMETEEDITGSRGAKEEVKARQQDIKFCLFDLAQFFNRGTEAVGIFNVRISNNIPDAAILKVYSMDGRLVLEQKNISNNKQIDLSKFGNGNYLLKLETLTGFYTRKIIVMK